MLAAVNDVPLSSTPTATVSINESVSVLPSTGAYRQGHERAPLDVDLGVRGMWVVQWHHGAALILVPCGRKVNVHKLSEPTPCPRFYIFVGHGSWWPAIAALAIYTAGRR